MRSATYLLALFLCTVPALAQQSLSDQEHTKWVASVIDSVGTIRPGMTRGDLLKMFGIERGLSSRQHRTYVYKQCPYMKVDVDFKPVGAPDQLDESATDQIVKISRPYFAYSVMD